MYHINLYKMFRNFLLWSSYYMLITQTVSYYCTEYVYSVYHLLIA